MGRNLPYGNFIEILLYHCDYETAMWGSLALYMALETYIHNM
jgi:hypothetical protein